MDLIKYLMPGLNAVCFQSLSTFSSVRKLQPIWLHAVQIWRHQMRFFYLGGGGLFDEVRKSKIFQSETSFDACRRVEKLDRNRVNCFHKCMALYVFHVSKAMIWQETCRKTYGRESLWNVFLVSIDMDSGPVWDLFAQACLKPRYETNSMWSLYYLWGVLQYSTGLQQIEGQWKQQYTRALLQSEVQKRVQSSVVLISPKKNTMNWLEVCLLTELRQAPDEHLVWFRKKIITISCNFRRNALQPYYSVSMTLLHCQNASSVPAVCPRRVCLWMEEQVASHLCNSWCTALRTEGLAESSTANRLHIPSPGPEKALECLTADLNAAQEVTLTREIFPLKGYFSFFSCLFTQALGGKEIVSLDKPSLAGAQSLRQRLKVHKEGLGWKGGLGSWLSKSTSSSISIATHSFSSTTPSYLL